MGGLALQTPPLRGKIAKRDRDLAPDRASHHRPQGGHMATKSIAERFWSRVNKTDTCWLWTAGVMGRTGYGGFRFDGCVRGAHRFSWQLAHGPIPGGAHVLHRCDVRLCVNPS